MIRTDGTPTIAMRESDSLPPIVDRGPGDETSHDPEAPLALEVTPFGGQVGA